MFNFRLFFGKFKIAMTVFDSLKTQICEEATQYVFKKNTMNYAEVGRTHLII